MRARRELRDMAIEEIIDRLYGLPLAEFTQRAQRGGA